MTHPSNAETRCLRQSRRELWLILLAWLGCALWVIGYAGTGERWKDDTGETVTVVLGGLLGLTRAAAQFHSPAYYYVSAGVGLVLGLIVVSTFCEFD